MDVFQSSLRVTFDRLGKVATFEPVVGTPIEVMVQRHVYSEDFQTYGLNNRCEVGVFSLLAADIAQPAEGDKINLDGEVFVIEGTPRKTHRGLVWRVEAQPDHES